MTKVSTEVYLLVDARFDRLHEIAMMVRVAGHVLLNMDIPFFLNCTNIGFGHDMNALAIHWAGTLIC